MNDAELHTRLHQFRDWYYEFDLDGYRTPLRHPESTVRHPQRRGYFFDPLVHACGGSLAGRRVFDLGCNEGYFSLAAAEAGCEFVLGIDAGTQCIEQARIVFEAKQICPSRYEFHCEDFFEALNRHSGPFEVVFALGILHWFTFADHLRFLQAVAQVNSDLLVIDTVVSSRLGSVLELRKTPLGPRDPHPEGRLRILPSPLGLLQVMKALGYQGVILKPCFSDWTDSDDYRDGVRRAFLFAKQTPLDRLTAPTESQGIDGDAPGLGDASGRALLRALAMKTARRLGLRRQR